MTTRKQKVTAPRGDLFRRAAGQTRPLAPRALEAGTGHPRARGACPVPLKRSCAVFSCLYEDTNSFGPLLHFVTHTDSFMQQVYEELRGTLIESSLAHKQDQEKVTACGRVARNKARKNCDPQSDGYLGRDAWARTRGHPAQTRSLFATSVLHDRRSTSAQAQHFVVRGRRSALAA